MTSMSSPTDKMGMLEKNTTRIAFLTAAACVLQVVESMVPHPFPGLRLGLGNVIALIALFDLGLAAALHIAVLRTVVASLLLGTFLSPPFFLSFAGAILSVSVVAFIYWLTIARGRVIFSIIGLSILGGVLHNLGQLFVIYLFLGGNKGTLLLGPWLVFTGVGTGLLTGLIAARALRLIRSQEEPVAPIARNDREPATTANQSTSGHASINLFLAIGFIILILIAPRPIVLFPVAFSTLVALYLVLKVPFTTLTACLKRSLFLIGFSFTISAVFAQGALVERMAAGTVLSGKIVLILLCTSLVTAITRPEDLARAMTKVLFPLRLVGLSPYLISRTIVEAMQLVPRFWEILREFRRSRATSTDRNIRQVIPVMASLVASVYLQANLEEVNPEQ